MNSNVRLQLSSLLSKEQADGLEPRVFGKEITNEYPARQASFFRHKSFLAEKREKPLFLQASERYLKPKVEQEQSASSNPQLTVYYEQICLYLAERDAKRESCQSGSLDNGHCEVTDRMRATLTDWLVDAHLGFKLLPQTLFKAMSLVDRYMSLVPTPFKKLQLVGTAALFISCKYEEIYPPSTRSFLELISKQHYTEDLVDMEGRILKALNFDLTFSTAAVHFERLAQHYKLQPKDISLCWYLLELSLSDHTYLKYTPLVMASSAIFLMKVIYKRSIDIKGDDCCKQCAKQLVLTLQNAPKNSLQASRIKYSGKQLHEVSKLIVRPNTPNQ